jgi:tRNA nucleotidyltransferase (CCA-adding enzyme)
VVKRFGASRSDERKPQRTQRQARGDRTAVRDAGGRALIVGGWVRDRLLGLPDSSNVDLEVFGSARSAARAARDASAASRRSAKAFRSTSSATSTCRCPRRDSKAGRGHRGFVVTAIPDMSIARRRAGATSPSTRSRGIR